MNRTVLATFLLALVACGGEDVPPPPTVFGGDRPAELDVPEIVDGETYPLVVSLHGHGINGFIGVGLVKMEELTDDGVFLIAPDGTENSVDGHTFWNAEAACCDHGDDAVDDVAYLGQLIEDVMAAWPIDPARVFVIGHSNGGFMAYRMACDRADLITAIAPLAGAATAIDGVDDCDPSRPVSVLHIHGDGDDTIPYAGGTTIIGTYPGAVASVEAWQALDGCDATRTPGDALDLTDGADGAETATEDADGCPDGVGVSLWTIQGGGHLPQFDPTFKDEVMSWFLAHAR